MSSNTALKAYRNLWRATGAVFKGDHVMLASARQNIRDKFNEQRSATLSADELKQAISHADEIAVFLRRNVVQGTKTSESEEQYHLHITKDTELGDNDSVKMPKATLSAGPGAGGCCGGSAATA